MKQRNLRTRAVSAAILATVIAGTSLFTGCLAEIQKAKEAFWDGQMPRQLFRTANQQDELANLPGLAESAAADANNKSLLEVAVIDDGVDLAQPDLAAKIAWTVKGGRLAGAGHDMMGDDEWSSANMIEPSLFAFGCKELRDGKIVEPPASPSGLLKSYNDAFLKDFLPTLQSDATIQNSLFKRITGENFTIVAAYKISRSPNFSGSSFAQAKEQGLLLPLDPFRLKTENPKRWAALARLFNGENKIKMLVTGAWPLESESGLPYLGDGRSKYTLTKFEGADRFAELVKASFARVDAQVGYVNAFNNFKNFRRGMEKKGYRSDDMIEDTIHQKLAHSLYVRLRGFESLDPAQDLARAVETDLYAQGKDVNEQTAAADVDNAIARLDRIAGAVEGLKDVQADTVTRARLVRKNLGALRELAKWYRAERGVLSNSILPPKASAQQKSAYHRYAVRTKLPYLSDQSNSQIHGTHVSTTIAAQNDRVRIVPVRVTTMSVATNDVELEKLKAEFKNEFAAWMADVIPFRAIGARFKGASLNVDFANESEPNRRAVAQALIGKLSDQIDAAFDGQALDFVFFREVEQAVRYVGERKIKLANVSLGEEFKATVAAPSSDDPDEALRESYKFLQFEFFKYRLAKTIQTYAPKTLFAVVAGNSGGWVDGESRSALPVDLSSPFLRDFERPAEGLVVPNNHLKNILAVGSLNPKDKLSSFTNVLLGTDTPFIFAHGESILAPIKTTDASGVEATFSLRLKALNDIDVQSRAYSELKPFYSAEAGVPTDANDEESETKRTEVSNRYANAIGLLKKMVASAKIHMFLKYPNHRARLSGTSMATPTTIGKLSGIVTAKADSLGVSARDLYDDPRFAPEAIVEDAFAQSEDLNKTHSRGITLKALLGDRTWQPSPAETDLEAVLRGIAERGKAATPTP